MPSDPLPVAVIGVGGFGRWTLNALRETPAANVVGLSDVDHRVADRAGRETGILAYSDNRSLLAETRPQAVFLATPPTAAPEILSACAERGIHVWKELPLARNLDEGVAMVRLMDQAKLKLAVGTQRRFSATYRRAWELRHSLGATFLARAHYLFNWGPDLRWRGDRASAGGGAMLELGYHTVDLLGWMLGLPEDVYGTTAGGNRPDEQGPEGEQLPLYDTDDTAACVLRYAGGAVATVVATRSSGPVSEALCLHGRRGSIEANYERCLLRDPDGNILDRTDEETAPLAVFRRQVEAFIAAVRDETPRYQASARENLLNLAVVEAVYLSGRTGQPEQPARLLHNHGLKEDDCLKPRPIEEPAEDVPAAEG